MLLPRKFRDIALCAALFGLPVIILHSNLKARADLNPLDRAVLKVSAPLQAVITGGVALVHRGFRRYVYLVGLSEDNERLTNENLELKRRLSAAQQQLQQLDRYRKLLDFRRRRSVETVGAYVIARPASLSGRKLRIRLDRGAAALRPGLPVVTAEGLVGRVGRVYGDYSDVLLVVDPRSSVDVVIRRTGARGVLRGRDSGTRLTSRVDYVLREHEVRVGDLIVTSGVAGVFPKDLPVARVARITEAKEGLYHRLEVSPVVDFGALEDVLVILAPPPPVPKRSQAHASRARGWSP